MIKDLDELERLLKMLRLQNVTAFKWSGLEVAMGENPAQVVHHNPINPNELISYPSQDQLDAAVGMPVGDIEDPFLTYNEQHPDLSQDEDQQG